MGATMIIFGATRLMIVVVRDERSGGDVTSKEHTSFTHPIPCLSATPSFVFDER
jgi:hypothetical protein